ncbi:MAG: acylphosphatase [Clostridia bacterium]|nr:acylphosphatase [Clostridia bacterium]
MAEQKNVRYYIVFKGRVQGVGFRYRAQHAAMENGITGWVRNEYDGSVSMEAQGPLVKVYQMLDMLESDRWIRIESKTMREIPVEPDEKAFRISH